MQRLEAVLIPSLSVVMVFGAKPQNHAHRLQILDRSREKQGTQDYAHETARVPGLIVLSSPAGDDDIGFSLEVEHGDVDCCFFSILRKYS